MEKDKDLVSVSKMCVIQPEMRLDKHVRVRGLVFPAKPRRP